MQRSAPCRGAGHASPDGSRGQGQGGACPDRAPSRRGARAGPARAWGAARGAVGAGGSEDAGAGTRLPAGGVSARLSAARRRLRPRRPLPAGLGGSPPRRAEAPRNPGFGAAGRAAGPGPAREIREAFRVLDRDGNGFISKQELGMAMRSLGYMPSEVELAIIMQRLDMDGDGQVDFDEFMTILGPKLVSSEGRDGFLGNTIDSIFWQFDMQRITLEELKHILYHAFRDHLTMKDIENIIINEEESLQETSENCQTEFEGVHAQKQNRQTCVRKSLICAFAMAFIISVMLIAANQILRSGME
uniref:calcium-binding protein 8 n=1 Tax=Panthera onca TaxID=9690 RepID=UPI002952F7DE|nr:calcium-binding protein 8 [Panthera onca]